ncbi:S1C family serine protease [Corynebacterium flavescens]|uniref:S1C family serine protease n=1 Tax=Corynebacterium flavescens TaxID=28028 RepID=UPI003FD6BABB
MNEPNRPQDPSHDDSLSQSQGWNRPRDDGAANGASGAYGSGTQGSAHTVGFPSSQFGQPYINAGAYNSAQQGQSAPNGQPQWQVPFGSEPGSGGAAPTAVAASTKNKRQVSLPAALALSLVAAVAAGTITGIAVGGNSNDDRATVNEVLNNQPVNNSTGEAPAEGSVEAVAAKALPSVVSIEAVTQTAASEGSGSIISPDGYVLTNHHVVAGTDRGGRLQVSMNDGSKHSATFVASDANTDVAIIKIDGVSTLPFLEFGNSDAVAVGQQVVAVGSPLGLNATVTSGIVSAKNRPVRASQEAGESSLIDAIQTDAAVNPGNSGGPLVDMNGNLVGMNSMIASLSNSAGSEAGSIGLGFAIPSNFAKRMADQLINNGSVKHPTLGVKVDARSSGNGAQIVEVEPGGPADKAGLKAGDVVTRVNDRLIENSDALIAAARSQDFGATVTLEVTSEGNPDPRKVEVTLSNE